MTRGLSRQQIGVTEELIQAYGERVWELSTNVQVRRGDAVRLLDWDKIEAQRPDTGMSDAEIADSIGLSRDQVLYIRLAMERRRFHRNSYHRLFDLGGGRRFRQDRFVPHEERFAFSDTAMELRRTMRFDPDLSARWLRLGYWNGETLAGWLAARAEASPERPAIVGLGGPKNDPMTYAEAYDTASRLATVLFSRGARRGDLVTVRLSDPAACVLAYFAVSLMGGVFYCPRDGAPIENPEGSIVVDDKEAAGGLSWDGLLEEARKADDTTAVDQPSLASDPAVLMLSTRHGGAPVRVVHNWHSLLSNARAVAPLYDGLAGEAAVPLSATLSEPAGLAAVNAAVYLGTPVDVFSGDRGPADEISLWGFPETLVSLYAEADKAAEHDGRGAFMPVRGTEHRIVSVDGDALPPEREGELEIRGPSVIAGYAGSADGLAVPFRAGGWYGAGLNALRDGDGNIRLT